MTKLFLRAHILDLQELSNTPAQGCELGSINSIVCDLTVTFKAL